MKRDSIVERRFVSTLLMFSLLSIAWMAVGGNGSRAMAQERQNSRRTASQRQQERERRDEDDAEGEGSLELFPLQLGEDRVEYELPAAYDDVCLAGSGRFLIFHFPSLDQLGFFDICMGRITKYVRLEDDDVRIAGGAENFYVAIRSTNIIQRWSLRTFERETAMNLPLTNPVDAIATGASATGPVYASAMHEPGLLLDPQRLRPMPIEVVDHVYQQRDAKVPGAGPESRVRASNDGRVFTFREINVSPGGFRTMLIDGRQAHVNYKHDTMGYIAPSPDGELMYTARGIFTYATEDYSANLELRAESFPIPAVDGPYSVWIARSDNGNTGVDATARATIHINGDAESIITIPELSIRSGNYGDFHAREAMTLDRRVWFVPAAETILTLPTSDRSVVMHRFALDRALEEADIDYLFVTSRPPAAVRRSGTMRYPIEVSSRHGGLTYQLESGPDRMSVSEDGIVTWRPARRDAGKEQVVIISIRDASGGEITHTFRFTVE